MLKWDEAGETSEIFVSVLNMLVMGDIRDRQGFTQNIKTADEMV